MQRVYLQNSLNNLNASRRVYLHVCVTYSYLYFLSASCDSEHVLDLGRESTREGPDDGVQGATTWRIITEDQRCPQVSVLTTELFCYEKGP